MGGAAPATATWNLPYPRTISYRVLGQSPMIKCKQTDSEFQREVTAAGLDDYEIYLTTGKQGTCDRAKAEQFKRLHPDKMVLLYENTGGSDPGMFAGGTWAGYYLMMNRTTAQSPVSASETSIPVSNPAAFSVGDTAVMWSPTDSDPYANSEFVRIKAINGFTLVVARNLFSTGAQAYATPPMIAATTTGPSYPNPVYNMSDVAPVNPANGERANQWMAQNMINDFASSNSDAPTLDGVEFDTASWTPPANNTNGAVKNFDCNGDGIIDYCNENSGATQVNSYGVGYDSFVQAVKQGLTVYDTDSNRPPKMVLADGELGLRSLGSANGAEFESFPSWDNYAYSSAALDTLDAWQNQDTAAGDHLSYAFTKDISPLYPQVSALNPHGCITPAEGGTCRNGGNRYGMAAALISGAASAYNNEDNFTYTQAWDEEATIDQATTGLAPGYLGQPLGPPVRSVRYGGTANMTVNPTFTLDLSNVSSANGVLGALTISRDVSTAAPDKGHTSLKAVVSALQPNPSLTDNHVSSALSGPVTPGEYTVDFWAKAASTTAGPQALNIGVSMDGVTGAPQMVMATNNWEHYYLQLNATTTAPKNHAVKFFLGTQIGSYWLDAVHVHRGAAGIITREFTNGIVVLNDSFSPQINVPLPGGPYHHINGVQDRSVNDGTEVGSRLPSIAAKDGEILLRG